MRNFYLWLPLLLLACQPAKAQIDFTDREQEIYTIRGREDEEALVLTLFKDALDPHRHVKGPDKAKQAYLETHNGRPEHTRHGRVYEQLMHYLDGYEEADAVTDISLSYVRLLEFTSGNMRMRVYDIPESGRVTEYYDADNRLRLFYANAVRWSDFRDWPGFDYDKHEPYLGSHHKSLFVFEYDSRGNISKTVEYSLPETMWPFDAMFEDRTGEKLPPPVPLYISAQLASPIVNAKTEKAAYPERLAGYLPSITEDDCNHGHICCNVGCDCCGKMPAPPPAPIVRSGPQKPDFTKTLEDGVRLDIFLSEEGTEVPPRYVFSSKRRAPVVYYSTLSNQGFVDAWQGKSALFEYNEKGEAWVLKPDRKTFCRIDKQGQEVPILLGADWQNEHKYGSSFPLGPNLYAVELLLHEHLLITGGDGQRVILTALTDEGGRVLPNSVLAGTVTGVIQNRMIVGEYTGGPWTIGESWQAPPLIYFMCDNDFKKLSQEYDEIDDHFGCGLARVRKGDTWGFIDTLGREAIACIYGSVSDFYMNDITPDFLNGKAIAVLDNLCGIIDTRGQTVIPFAFETIGGFSEELAAVRQGGLYGYIDTRGRLVIPCLYETANYFKEGKALVQKRNAAGKIDSFYIDKKGRELPVK